MFNLKAMSWLPAPPLLRPRSGCSAVATAQGALVLGGWDGSHPLAAPELVRVQCASGAMAIRARHAQAEARVLDSRAIRLRARTAADELAVRTALGAAPTPPSAKRPADDLQPGGADPPSWHAYRGGEQKQGRLQGPRPAGRLRPWECGKERTDAPLSNPLEAATHA